jgi:hypothetical protein
MAEWFYLECVLADRERELQASLGRGAAFRRSEPGEERPVLTAGFEGWTWLRTGQVGALVGLALLATLALPMGILGAAWLLRGILALLVG